MKHLQPSDMKSPITGGKVFLVTDKEERTYKGESFLVDVQYYQCIDTGEEFTTAEQDQMWYDQIVSLYQEKHLVGA